MFGVPRIPTTPITLNEIQTLPAPEFFVRAHEELISLEKADWKVASLSDPTIPLDKRLLQLSDRMKLVEQFIARVIREADRILQQGDVPTQGLPGFTAADIALIEKVRMDYLEIRRPAFEKDSPVVAAVIHQKFFAELTDEKRAETTNGAYPRVISYLQTKRTSVAQFYLTYLRTNAIHQKRFRAMLDKHQIVSSYFEEGLSGEIGQSALQLVPEQFKDVTSKDDLSLLLRKLVVMNPHREVVDSLLKAGADAWQMAETSGMTAIDRAMFEGHFELAKYLSDKAREKSGIPPAVPESAPVCGLAGN